LRISFYFRTGNIWFSAEPSIFQKAQKLWFVTLKMITGNMVLVYKLKEAPCFIDLGTAVGIVHWG
jgi:hypothetical protein